MTITANIIADSIGPTDIRLTTMQLRYPRFIHAEFMTHRVFSRNASSSRAIPVAKLIEDIRRDPAMPIFWGSNKPGMQAGDELNANDIIFCKEAWLGGLEAAIDHATTLMDIGLHKQIANRILEPWAHINVVVTATDWDNFWELRCHPDAQPEMRILAETMREAYQESGPTRLQAGQWHLPYVDQSTWNDITGNSEEWLGDAIRASVARCARVSYLTFEGKEPNLEEDLKLYERLVGGVPLHASPAEHQATPDVRTWMPSQGMCWTRPEEHGNFTGWRQFRKQLERQI
jgi:hypothetical protein